MLMVDQGMSPGWSSGVNPIGLAPWPEIHPARYGCAPEGDELRCHRGAISGLERRLERQDDEDDDSLSLVRIILSQHYAAYANAMIRRLGGDVRGMKALTDRNNIIPLACRGPDICNDD